MATTQVASDPASVLPPGAFQRTAPWSERVWSGLLWGTMTLFIVNIGLMIESRDEKSDDDPSQVP